MILSFASTFIDHLEPMLLQCTVPVTDQINGAHGLSYIKRYPKSVFAACQTWWHKGEIYPQSARIQRKRNRHIKVRFWRKSGHARTRAHECRWVTLCPLCSPFVSLLTAMSLTPVPPVPSFVRFVNIHGARGRYFRKTPACKLRHNYASYVFLIPQGGRI